MTVAHLSKTHAPCRDHRTWVGLMLIAVGSLAFAAEAAEETTGQASGDGPTITAVHKAQEVSFTYRSSAQYYSCHDLEHRVGVILRAIGARDDISVQARNCDAVMISGDRSMDIDPTLGRNTSDPFGRDRSDPFGRDQNDPWGRSGSFRRPGSDREQSVHVRVRLMMPVEVTPQILKEIEKDKSRRDLVSRVTGNPAAAMNDPIVFAARRQDVTLSQSTIRLRAEDCDLLQQMTMQVIRRLDVVRVKNQSFNCGPRSSSRIPPQLTVETLVPTGQLLPMPDPEKMKTPGASDAPETQASDTEPAQ